MSSIKTRSDVRKDNENLMKNIIGMTVAVTTIITVGLTVNFLIVPNIPIPVPTI